VDAGLVAQPPQQCEVGVDLAVEHRLEVELDERLPGQADVVPQDAELQAVADEAPQVGLGAVQELLHQAVRAGFLAPGRLDPLVQVLAEADEVDRAVVADVGDRVLLAVDLEGPGRVELAVLQRPPERQQPLVQGNGVAGVARRQLLRHGLERIPGWQQPVPGVVGGLVDLLPGQAVVLGTEPPQADVTGRDPLEQIDGQD
jgi:hypothetical protein